MNLLKEEKKKWNPEPECYWFCVVKLVVNFRRVEKVLTTQGPVWISNPSVCGFVCHTCLRRVTVTGRRGTPNKYTSIYISQCPCTVYSLEIRILTKLFVFRCRCLFLKWECILVNDLYLGICWSFRQLVCCIVGFWWYWRIVLVMYYLE